MGMNDGRFERPFALYVRVSERGGRDELELRSPELQERRIREWAASHRVCVSAEVFGDIDVSGGKVRREALDAAIDGVREKRYGGVIVARLSRFARSLAGGTRVERQIRLLGGQLVACDFPVDTTTAAGRQIFRTFLGWYEYELDSYREYSEETRRAKIEAGIYISGRPPAGYQYTTSGQTRSGRPLRGKLVPNEHAPAVRRAFEARAAGGSWYEVAQILSEAAVPTSRGRTHWSLSSTESVIKNPVYMGTVGNGGIKKVDEETGELYRTPRFEKRAAHTAIVDPVLWRKANARKHEPAGLRKDGPLLGSGLCRCATCGKGLTKGSTRQRGKRYSYYRCWNIACPGRVAIYAAKLEPWVLVAAFSKCAADRGGESADRHAARERLTAAHTALLELETLRRTFRPASFALAHSDALAELEAAEDAEAAFAPLANTDRLLTALDSRDRFEILPLPEKRRALCALITRIVITPGRVPASERIQITFRDGSTHPPSAAAESKKPDIFGLC
jgi:DNA invertase Pin-like site-specific DNA recombinase